jgi:hypothetical protein
LRVAASAACCASAEQLMPRTSDRLFHLSNPAVWLLIALHYKERQLRQAGQ